MASDEIGFTVGMPRKKLESLGSLLFKKVSLVQAFRRHPGELSLSCRLRCVHYALNGGADIVERTVRPHPHAGLQSALFREAAARCRNLRCSLRARGRAKCVGGNGFAEALESCLIGVGDALLVCSDVRYAHRNARGGERTEHALRATRLTADACARISVQAGGRQARADSDR